MLNKYIVPPSAQQTTYPRRTCPNVSLRCVAYTEHNAGECPFRQINALEWHALKAFNRRQTGSNKLHCSSMPGNTTPTHTHTFTGVRNVGNPLGVRLWRWVQGVSRSREQNRTINLRECLIQQRFVRNAHANCTASRVPFPASFILHPTCPILRPAASVISILRLSAPPA